MKNETRKMRGSAFHLIGVRFATESFNCKNSISENKHNKMYLYILIITYQLFLKEQFSPRNKRKK